MMTNAGFLLIMAMLVIALFLFGLCVFKYGRFKDEITNRYKRKD